MRLWLLSLVVPAVLQAQGLTVERRSASPISVDAGEQVTLIFRSSNRATQPARPRSRLDAPADWRVVIADTVSALEGGGSHVSLFLLAVPATARPGAYALRFHVATGVDAVDSVIVVVGMQRRIETSPLSSPKFVAAGEAYDTRFVVRNSGNARATIELRAKASSAAKARLDSAVVHLEPGETRTVRVSVQTSEDIGKMIAQTVQLTAAVAGDSIARANSASVVQVIPVHTAGPERFRSVPAQLVLLQSGASGAPVPELRGAGFLTPKGSNRIDFLLRGPQAPGAFLSQPDEYTLGLSAARRYRLKLGDQGYRASRMTENGRPSFGADGELHLAGDGLVLSGFGQRDRRTWALTHEQTGGGSADYRVTDGLWLGGGYAHRSGVDFADIWTARGTLSPTRRSELGWEYGKSSGAHGDGSAIVATLNGVVAAGHVGYGARHEQADTGFGGIWRGTQYDEASLSVRLPAQIAAITTITQSSHDQLLFVGLPKSRERIAETGLVFRSLLETSFRRREQSPSALLQTPERTTNSIRVGSGTGIGAVYMHADVEGGRTASAGSSVTKPYMKASARMALALQQQSLSLSVNRFNGTPSYAFDSRSETAVSAAASLRLTAGTRLIISGTGTRRGGPDARTYSIVDVGVGQELPHGHRTRVQARSVSSGTSIGGFDKRALMQQTEYMLPLPVPIGAAADGGRVEVTLVDAATNRPVNGILMRMGGEARFTDAAGRATFSGLEPGNYYLEVDREKLGTGRTVSPIMPLAVKVSGKGAEHVDLRLTDAARVTGRVRLMAYAPNRPFGAPDSLIDAGPYTGLVVSLVDGDTLRAMVDAFGQFRFDALHPGAWTLRSVSGLGQDYRLDRTEIHLDLAGGASSEIELHAIPLRVAPRFQPTEVIPSVPVSTVVDAPPVSAPPPAIAPAKRKPGPTLPPRPPLPTAGADWVAPRVSHHYTVTRHDVGLMAIARALYDDPALWPKIWYANLDLVASPETIRPGQRLRIPDKAPLTAAEIALRVAYERHRRP